MKPFEIELLLAPALLIFLVTMCVAFRVTRSSVFCIVAAFVKTSLFIFYYGLLFDGTFTFLDDWTYLEGGTELLSQGVGFSNLKENFEFTLMIGRGDHFLYYLYNTYAFRVFGNGYYAPVALNILLTILVAWFGTHLAAREFGLSVSWKKYFFGFLLLHPDILAWSNVMNGKDILVLLLHVLLLLSCSLLFERKLGIALLLAFPVCVILFFTRFYVPLLFVVALLGGVMLAGDQKGRMKFFMVAGFLFILVFSWTGFEGLNYAVDLVREDMINPLYGFVRAVFTPIPFHTEKAYSFLDMPALIHWLLFPFAFWGGVMIYRLRTPFSRFFLFYLFVFTALYSMYGELQGPRHRVQLDYGWAVLQFLGIAAFLHSSIVRHLRFVPPASDARVAVSRPT